MFELGFLLIAGILGIPVVAIVAIVKSSANQRQLTELRLKFDALTRQVETLRGEAAPSRDARETVVEDAKPETSSAYALPADPGLAREEFSPTPDEPAAEVADTYEPAPPPHAPTEIRKLEDALTSRWLVWLGAVAIGLAGVFLVKYAIDNALLTPAMRVVLGFLLGIALAVGGEILRRKPMQRAIAAVRPNYVPPALTASGLFVAFASVYAAYALYNLLSPLAGFIALAAIALSGVGLSLLQGRFVALMGLLGAFVTPALVSTNDPSAWTLFSYLLIVESGCLALSRYRRWSLFALAALAGVAIWPLLWMAGAVWHVTDALPLGIYLLLSAAAYFFLFRWGWANDATHDSWLQDFRDWDMSERVVAIAGVTIAFLLFVVVAQAAYNSVSMVLFGLTAALYLFAGRREGVFDALSVVAAIAALAVVATMPVPGIINLPDPLTRAPIVPRELDYFARSALAFGLLFGIGGFAAQWGARRPAIWAGVSAFVPVSLLAICYWRVVDFGVDLEWAGIAVALAAISLFAAERVERYRAARGLDVSLGFYAAAVAASLSLAFAMSLREAWLTVTLSLQLPALGAISRKIDARAIRYLAGIVAGIVLARLAFNFDVLSYPAAPTSAFNWIVYGYGIPAAACFFAAQLFRRGADDVLVVALQAAGLAFSVLLVSLEIRLFIEGSLAVARYTLLDQSLQSIAWLTVGIGLAVREARSRSIVARFGSRVLLGAATTQIALLQLGYSNPLLTGDAVGNYPLLNVLMLAYLIPAIFAFVFAAMTKNAEPSLQWQRPIAAGAGVALLFVYISLEVRRAFHGAILTSAERGDAELYAYSAAWLIYAAVLLGLGIRLAQAPLRYAGLAILMLTATKVFLVDMGDLTGLYRVASFLGLGLSLVAIGYLYQRFVNVRAADT